MTEWIAIGVSLIALFVSVTTAWLMWFRSEGGNMSVQEGTTLLPDLSPDQRFQVALACFENQAQVIRALKENDLQVVGGVMTLQLALAAWLAEHPPTGPEAWGLLVLSISLASLSLRFLYKNDRRRRQVVASLKSTKAALRLNEKDVYVKGAALDAQVDFKPSFWLYAGVFFVTTGAVAVVIFGGQF